MRSDWGTERTFATCTFRFFGVLCDGKNLQNKRSVFSNVDATFTSSFIWKCVCVFICCWIQCLIHSNFSMSRLFLNFPTQINDLNWTYSSHSHQKYRESAISHIGRYAQLAIQQWFYRKSIKLLHTLHLALCVIEHLYGIVSEYTVNIAHTQFCCYVNIIAYEYFLFFLRKVVSLSHVACSSSVRHKSAIVEGIIRSADTLPS